MSDKIEITREKIERAIDAIEQVGYQDKFIDYTFVQSVKAELRAVLAQGATYGEVVAVVTSSRWNSEQGNSCTISPVLPTRLEAGTRLYAETTDLVSEVKNSPFVCGPACSTATGCEKCNGPQTRSRS